jgi:hypothetical protein
MQSIVRLLTRRRPKKLKVGDPVVDCVARRYGHPNQNGVIVAEKGDLLRVKFERGGHGWRARKDLKRDDHVQKAAT